MPEPARRPLVIFIYIALAIATLLLYWQVRGFDFVNYDDYTYVYENPHVQSGLTADGVARAFTTSQFGYWQPLTWLSLMLNRQLFGSGPGGFHLVNLLLHLANTLLLFAFLRKTTGTLWPGAFVAAAFALHPMHVESVAWISERKDVLSTLFLLLTLVTYAGYVKRPTVFRYIGALMLFAAGLMAKPMLVTLPFLLLLLDYWPLNRLTSPATSAEGARGGKSVQSVDRPSIRRCLVEKIPFLVLAGVFCVITLLTQAASLLVNTVDVPVKMRIAHAFLAYAVYVGKMFWPRNLAVFYSFDAEDIQLRNVALCALLIVAISVWVIRARRQREYLFTGWFWFVGTLVPVIGLVRFTDSPYADRFTYVPYIGLFVMLAWGLPELLSKWPYRKMALGILGVTALTAMGIRANRQLFYWRDSLALLSHAVEITPDDAVARNNLGTAYGSLGRWQEAIESLQRSMQLSPGYADAHFNLGVIYSSIGRWQEAVESFRQAIKLMPDYADSHYGLGGAYAMLGRWQEAMDAYRQTIELRPDNANAYFNLGVSFVHLGRHEDAIDAYRQAVRLDPGYAEAHYSLAHELAPMGNFSEAVDHLRIAVRLRPDWPECISDLADIIAASPDIPNRDIDEAIRLASRACQLSGNKNPAFMATLAAAYAAAGRFAEAVDTANRALAMAEAAGQTKLRDIIRERLTFYTQGKRP